MYRSMKFKCINRKHVRPCSCCLSHNTVDHFMANKWFTYQNKWECAPEVYKVAKWNKVFGSQSSLRKTKMEEKYDGSKKFYQWTFKKEI